MRKLSNLDGVCRSSKEKEGLTNKREFIRGEWGSLTEVIN